MSKPKKLKFEDCEDCSNRFKSKLCGQCDYGELFTEDDTGTELDFKEETARTIDSAIIDRAARRFLEIIDRED